MKRGGEWSNVGNRNPGKRFLGNRCRCTVTCLRGFYDGLSSWISGTGSIANSAATGRTPVLLRAARWDFWRRHGVCRSHLSADSRVDTGRKSRFANVERLVQWRGGSPRLPSRRRRLITSVWLLREPSKPITLLPSVLPDCRATSTGKESALGWFSGILDRGACNRSSKK